MKKNLLVLITFCLGVFLSSFLMFIIQPLVGKIILPQYGGVAQIWCVCLFFFQFVLLAGYIFAHLLSGFSLKTQGILYIFLAIISALTLKIPLNNSWIISDHPPSLSILLILCLYFAVPIGFLSTLSIILQNWHGKFFRKNPYYLYSLSNIGAFLALFIYPIIIEPSYTLSDSVGLWTKLYKILSSIICLLSSVLIFNFWQEKNNLTKNEDQESISKPTLKHYLLWIFYSFIGNVTLLSFTSHILQDIAPVPLLWVLPLSVYLGAFAICFSSEKVYNRTFFFIITPILIFLYIFNFNEQKLLLLLVNLVILFCISFICCGETYKYRPNRYYLSIFYLMIAFGGVLGGFFINFIAPILFKTYLEFYLIILFMVLFISFQIYNYAKTAIKFKFLCKTYSFLLILLLSVLFYVFFMNNKKSYTEILTQRNFYGTIKVLSKENRMLLAHGTVLHGFQEINSKNSKFLNIPTLYYSENSAFGIAHKLFREHRNNNNNLKIGAIGLGIGTIAAYGKNGDEFIFYELDPKIKDIALNKFGFIKNSPAKINIIMGDGRLSLKNQPKQNFDIILVDVFNGDAIPIHVLTKEALKIYLKHLKKDGLILIHTSNNYVNLSLITQNLAADSGLRNINFYTKNDGKYTTESTYTIFSKDDWIIDKITDANFKKEYPYTDYKIETKSQQINKRFLWTDNYSNLFNVLRLK